MVHWKTNKTFISTTQNLAKCAIKSIDKKNYVDENFLNKISVANKSLTKLTKYARPLVAQSNRKIVVKTPNGMKLIWFFFSSINSSKTKYTSIYSLQSNKSN